MEELLHEKKKISIEIGPIENKLTKFGGRDRRKIYIPHPKFECSDFSFLPNL